MFQKLLIANRGEIACRIIKTAKKMGIKTVAIYSTEDSQSLHVMLADEAYCVGGAKAIDSYLQIENIINVAKKSQADAIHPGYGFLSESSSLAERCAKENIVFVGPSIDALHTMGSKQLAKQLLEKTSVPLTPGYHGNQQSEEHLLAEAKKIGFPILLKASDGGGGKGMRIVENAEEFAANLASAKRESMASFASDTMLIEKLIIAPRHIEVQIIADNYGEVLHLFERDCSIQRRHQKIIEEAPATLSPKFRENITKAAVEVAKAINYSGAGTIEFLSDGTNFYFMEMNTRLQVEHPVTEMITGLDLVELQLKIAAGESLKIKQSDIKIHGHAIECRIYAEDPENNFMPSIGKINFLQQETNEFVRIDCGITTNSIVSRYYDPMLAKIIAWGETREEARTRLHSALDKFYLTGVKNNVLFLKTVLQNPKFISNNVSTNFLNEEHISPEKPDYILAGFLAASLDYLTQQTTKDSILNDTYGFQMHLPSIWHKQYSINGKQINVEITPKDKNHIELTVLNLSQEELRNSMYHHKISAYINIDSNQLIFNDNTKIEKYLFHRETNKSTIFTNNGNLEIKEYTQESKNTVHIDNKLTAPMPGTIIAILKKTNERIQSGDALIIMEAMKMEHTILAPRDGTISTIFYDIGAQVQEGATLVAMEKP